MQEAPKDHTLAKLPFNMGEREIFGLDRFKIFKHDTMLSSFAWINFKKDFHGPPAYAHGGAQAYILDEVMGCTGWMHGIPVVAKKIEIEFKKPCPLNEALKVFCRIELKEAKEIKLSAELLLQSDEVVSKAKGVFSILSKEKLKNLKKS